MATKESLYNAGRIILAGTALSAGACSVEQKNPNLTQEPTVVTKNIVLTQAEIQELMNYEKWITESAVVRPADEIKAAFVEPTQNEQIKPEMTVMGAQLLEKYNVELPEILLRLGLDSIKTEDLEMYYPIYRTAQDKYGVPWELMWIIHEAESTASRNEAAFENNIHYGAMQRALEFHPQEDIDRANVGMEYLQTLPVRHFDDAAEIVWAAAAVAEWAGEEKDYARALYKYSASGPAADRLQKFKELELLLGE